MPSLLTAASVREIVELRRSRRFLLAAPAFFCWVDRDGILQERSGTTRDMCMAGAFIVSETVPPTGARVGVEVYLPAEVGSCGLELHGEGRVVRVEHPAQSGSGFATQVVFQTQPLNYVARLGPHENQ
jgi:hypothetical protein